MKLSKLALIFLFLIFDKTLFASETTVFKVGAFDSYPLIFQDSDGQIKGLYVDLLTEISKQENIHLDYIFGTWEEGLQRIQSGEVDMLTSVGFTDERSKYMDYCKNPLLTVWGELYTLRSSEINGILELRNKKIGVLKSDIFLKNFHELTSKLDIKTILVEYSSYDDVFKAIMEKKVDGGIVDVTFGTAKQKEYKLRSSGIVFNPLDIYFTTGKNRNESLRSLSDLYLNYWKHQDDSVFSRGKQKWLYGSVGAVAIIPSWLKKVLIAFGTILMIAFIFIILLNKQVRKATKSIFEKDASLRESENRFSLFMDHLPLFVFIKECEGKLLYINKTMDKTLGASKWIGLTTKEIFDKNTTERKIFEDQQILHTGYLIIEEQYTHLDGLMADYETQKFIIPRAGQKPLIGGIANNITERKKADEAIRSFTTLLEKKVEERTAELANAYSEMESFAYSVSHDLRAPLRAIDGFSQIILEDYINNLDEDGQKALKYIRLNTQKMDQLLVDILALSKITKSELNFTTIDMQNFIKLIYREAADEKTRKQFELILHPLPSSYADKLLLHQVWFNLISNAFKYSMRSTVKKIEIGSFSENNEHIYYIKDFGAGFDANYKHKLFGVFQRLHNSKDFEGTGIGLSIVKRIITRHQGRVWAEGNTNEGATFYFSLPIIAEKNHKS